MYHSKVLVDTDEEDAEYWCCADETRRTLSEVTQEHFVGRVFDGYRYQVSSLDYLNRIGGWVTPDFLFYDYAVDIWNCRVGIGWRIDGGTRFFINEEKRDK